MTFYKDIQCCRICGNLDLDLIIELGDMALAGVFPKTSEEEVPVGPLTLVKCRESPSGDFCGLVQLREIYDPNMMYGHN